MEREESMSVKSQREQRKDKFILTKAGNRSEDDCGGLIYAADR